MFNVLLCVCLQNLFVFVCFNYSYLNHNVSDYKKPSIEPGNQLCKGNWALLAHAPPNNSKAIIVKAVSFI